jgi:hypothetical protein
MIFRLRLFLIRKDSVMVRFYSPHRALFFILFTLGFASSSALAQNWVPDTVGLSQNVGSLAINTKGVIFAGAQSPTNGGGFSPNGIFLSINNGSSWSPCPSPTFDQDVITLGPVWGIDSKEEIFVGAGLREAFSTNNGSSWQEIELDSSAPYDGTISNFAIGFTGTILVAFDGGSSLLSSSSYGRGTSWDDQGVDNTNSQIFPTFVAYNPAGNFFAGTNTALYESTGITGEFWGNNANNAISGAPSFGLNVNFAFNSTGQYNNNTIIVGGGSSDGAGGGGLFLSTNNGTKWTSNISPPATNINTIFALAIGKNGNIFAGLSTGGMYVSTDTGQSWNDISSGLASTTVNALAIDTATGTLYAGTNNGVFQYVTSTNPVPPSGVKSNASDVPSSLTLEQNAPNPVVSSTAIQFTVPESGQVSLNVFDATGREVAAVANGYYAPGTYSVAFDAHTLPDGAYYYRIESGGQSAARMFAVEH